MIRGTTPDYILTIEGYDLTDKTVYVTIESNRKKITKKGDQLSIAYDGTASAIAFTLTQQDTLFLAEGRAAVQVRFIDDTGKARATEIGMLTVNKVLLEKVISYE